jgi:hypothetical protein
MSARLSECRRETVHLFHFGSNRRKFVAGVIRRLSILQPYVVDESAERDFDGSVFSSWGTQQYRRDGDIAWTGATTVAVLCGTVGLIVAFHPGLWMGFFTDAPVLPQDTT